MSSEQAQQRIQTEAHNDFPFPSFPTPPPSKGEDELKILSVSAKKNSQNNNSWSYEDQFKQVRQVSKRECLELPFNCAVSINNSALSRLLSPGHGLDFQLQAIPTKFPFTFEEIEGRLLWCGEIGNCNDFLWRDDSFARISFSFF